MNDRVVWQLPLHHQTMSSLRADQTCALTLSILTWHWSPEAIGGPVCVWGAGGRAEGREEGALGTSVSPGACVCSSLRVRSQVLELPVLSVPGVSSLMCCDHCFSCQVQPLSPYLRLPPGLRAISLLCASGTAGAQSRCASESAGVLCGAGPAALGLMP